MSEEKTDPYKTGKAVETKATVGNAGGAVEVPTTDALRRLASFVEAHFRINRDHRHNSGVDEMLRYAAQSNRMRYSSRQEQVLMENGIDVYNYPPLTPTKNRSMQALLNDIVKASGDKVYVLSPTPKPELPKSAQREIMQKITGEIMKFFQQVGGAINDPEALEAFYLAIVSRTSAMYDERRRLEDEWAKERCGRMDRLIHDQLVEADFKAEFKKLILNLCVYGNACMIGPCPRVVAKCECREVDGIRDALKYTRTYKVIPTFESVNPWDCYPAPNSKHVGDGILCFKVRFTASELWQFAEAMGEKENPEGWQRQTVRALLSRYPNGGCRLDADPYDLVRRDAERDSIVGVDDCTLEGIRCFAPIRGSELIKYGIFKTSANELVSQHKYYKTETIVIGGFVVYCRVIDDRMLLPVVKATLYESPDSWWGETIANYCRVPQSMQNNSFKNYTLNNALSSNPMFVCNDVNNMVSLDGRPALLMRAGRMLGRKASQLTGSSGSPVSVLQVPDTTQSQLKTMQMAFQLADDYSGVPQYSVGSSTTLGSGAGRTASGLSMMEAATCRVVNMCVCNIGVDVIVPLIKNLNAYNLLYSDDMSVKGDVDVNPAGLMGKILREAESQRRQQVTAMLGQHPVLSQAITVEGFFELIRPELDGIGVNPDKIIPSKERIELIQQMNDFAHMMQVAGAGGNEGAEPTPEQANQARVEGNPQQVALEQGAQEPRPGTVAERRGAA